MADTSTGTMTKAVLIAIGATSNEADELLAGPLADRFVPLDPFDVVTELGDALSRLRRYYARRAA